MSYFLYNRVSTLMYIVSAFALLVQMSETKVQINADQEKRQISKHSYGHFAEHLADVLMVAPLMEKLMRKSQIQGLYGRMAEKFTYSFPAHSFTLLKGKIK